MPASTLPRFVVLYSALFAAFGVASPFLPALLAQRGLTPFAIGLVLGLGSAVRLATGPLGAQLADRSGAPRLVLSAGLAAAAVVALGYAPARGLLPLALISVAHAAVLAPLTPIADSLAVGGAQQAGGFDYGWVRGAGSTAFILGSVAAGQAVGWAGLGVIIPLNAVLLLAAAAAALRVSNRPIGRVTASPDPAKGTAGSLRDLVRLPAFARFMVVAALVGGSHALHDGFEVIRWRAAGIGPGAAGLLWGESVAAEMLVFFVAGGPLIDRLGPGGAAMLSAGAGVVRWATVAQTVALPAMALVEPLHGLTFALLHLSCMRMIARVVPEQLSATAQAFYGTVAVGAASTALTFASGPLYGHFGGGAFWFMAALCAAALPVAYGLRGSVPAAGPAAGDGPSEGA